MAYDFKKEFKEFYGAKSTPSIVIVPKLTYISVHGKGDPNDENGEYKNAVELLYGVAYTLKMSYKTSYKINGFFEYVVPPLEGLWWQDGIKGVDYKKKDQFEWISLIRLPNFIAEPDVIWAKETAAKKKKTDFSKLEFFTYDEGLCVQCLHVGPYDDEPVTTAKMEEFAKQSGYSIDISKKRHHHEIYLSDPRKTDASKLKTIIRHPIK